MPQHMLLLFSPSGRKGRVQIAAVCFFSANLFHEDKMMRAIKLSIALFLAACLLSGCYVYHPDRDGRHQSGGSGPQQQQQQKVPY